MVFLNNTQRELCYANISSLCIQDDKTLECEPWEIMREYLYFLQISPAAERSASEEEATSLQQQLSLMMDSLTPMALGITDGNHEEFSSVTEICVEMVMNDAGNRLQDAVLLSLILVLFRNYYLSYLLVVCV